MITPRTTRLVRVCSGTQLAPGDMVRLTVGGTRVLEVPLAPTAEEEARGAALLASGTIGTLPAVCGSPSSLSARLSCSWARESAP